MGQVHAHSDVVRVLLGCHHNRGAPFCWICDRGDDALSFEDLEFGLQLISVSKWDSAWCFDAKWFGSFGECDLKLFAVHFTIEYGWELFSMGLVLSFIIVATDVGGLSGLLRGDG